jgi:uncharacterized membrane protein
MKIIKLFLAIILLSLSVGFIDADKNVTTTTEKSWSDMTPAEVIYLNVE